MKAFCDNSLRAGKAVCGQEVLDDLVSASGVVMEVDAMSGVWLEVGFEDAGAGESDFRCTRNADTIDTSTAVTTAVDAIDSVSAKLFK